LADVSGSAEVTGSVRGAVVAPREPPPSYITGGNAASTRSKSTVIASLPPEDQPEQGPSKELPERFHRQIVNFTTTEPAGTVIIDTPNTSPYLVLGNGKAIRYGVGFGREGFTWSGSERISGMKEGP